MLLKFGIDIFDLNTEIMLIIFFINSMTQLPRNSTQWQLVSYPAYFQQNRQSCYKNKTRPENVAIIQASGIFCCSEQFSEHLVGLSSCAQISSNLFSSKVYRPIHFVQSYQVRLGLDEKRLDQNELDEKQVYRLNYTRRKEELQGRET